MLLAITSSSIRESRVRERKGQRVRESGGGKGGREGGRKRAVGHHLPVTESRICPSPGREPARPDPLPPLLSLSIPPPPQTRPPPSASPVPPFPHTQRPASRSSRPPQPPPSPRGPAGVRGGELRGQLGRLAAGPGGLPARRHRLAPHRRDLGGRRRPCRPRPGPALLALPPPTHTHTPLLSRERSGRRG